MSTPVIYPGTLYHLLTIEAVKYVIEHDDMPTSAKTNYELLLNSLQRSYDEVPEEEDGKEFLK